MNDVYYSWLDEYVRGSLEPDVHALSARYDVRQKEIIQTVHTQDLDTKRARYQKESKALLDPNKGVDKDEVKEKHRKTGELFQKIILEEVTQAYGEPDGGLNIGVLKCLNLAVKTMKDAIDIESKALDLYREDIEEEGAFDGEIKVTEVNPTEHRQSIAKKFLDRNKHLPKERLIELLDVILESSASDVREALEGHVGDDTEEDDTDG